ncbi:DUF2147 domain-containing protein [Gammaproteobacteria bacterium]|nr:DUF2147 domain-containing protein [Gammaproteobacteria bacterium]
MHNTFLYVFFYFLITLSQSANAIEKNDFVDLWRTYDLKKNLRSTVRFYINNNELKADIVESLNNKQKNCQNCKGKFKNKPYIGMNIINGLKFNNNKWVNGNVLDTDTGNFYKCNISISKDKKVMFFHAYKGFPIFGQTMQWKRVESK